MNITKRPSPNINKSRLGHTPDMIVCHTTEGSYAGAVSWLSDPQSQVSAHFVVARDGRITQLVEIEDTAWANGTNNTQSSNLWNGFSTLPAVRERNVNANLYTISIEHEGKYAETSGALTPVQLEATIQLVAYIREEVYRIYGSTLPLTRQNIVAHGEITPKTRPNCPGGLFPFQRIIDALEEQLAEQNQEPNNFTKDTGVSPGGIAKGTELFPNDFTQGTKLFPGDITQNTDHFPSDFAKEAWEWAINNNITDGTHPKGTITREQVITMLHRYHKINGGQL
jgi:N-acetyl-anhydromuramyl-L-alanine amidase AmpD